MSISNTKNISDQKKNYVAIILIVEEKKSGKVIKPENV